eukprot:TRINITY_DN3140_c0_g1_i1.p2 TRINITY_DN3140_c0_g1~~TRINITY_DN3140_c0_g1_i1.p2  ORF type:complete len:116 (-),score=0.82 TRINITY_DN3140_c0_g1_i1:195-542(-)
MIDVCADHRTCNHLHGKIGMNKDLEEGTEGGDRDEGNEKEMQRGKEQGQRTLRRRNNIYKVGLTTLNVPYSESNDRLLDPQRISLYFCRCGNSECYTGIYAQKLIRMRRHNSVCV